MLNHIDFLQCRIQSDEYIDLFALWLLQTFNDMNEFHKRVSEIFCTFSICWDIYLKALILQYRIFFIAFISSFTAFKWFDARWTPNWHFEEWLMITLQSNIYLVSKLTKIDLYHVNIFLPDEGFLCYYYYYYLIQSSC